VVFVVSAAFAGIAAARSNIIARAVKWVDFNFIRLNFRWERRLQVTMNQSFLKDFTLLGNGKWLRF
jgi:hypothetical protein